MQTPPKLLAVLTVLVLAAGCSVKKIAVNKLGNALASTGTTFEGDDDPELIGEALPFALKLMESLLAESPKHTGLLMATASGFTQYSYVYVGQKADRAFTESVEESKALRQRARRLYLRAWNYGKRGLEARYPGFGAALDQEPEKALARVKKRDIALLYWTAAAHGLAISSSKDDPEMIAQLPVVEAFVRRVSALDETWNEGAAPEFLISLESAKSGVKLSDQQANMRRYYDRALQLSGGRRASLFVSFAENASVPAQNRAQFKELLDRALAIDCDKQPASRLANLVAQRRAHWLLGRIDELFLER